MIRPFRRITHFTLSHDPVIGQIHILNIKVAKCITELASVICYHVKKLWASFLPFVISILYKLAVYVRASHSAGDGTGTHRRWVVIWALSQYKDRLSGYGDSHYNNQTVVRPREDDDAMGIVITMILWWWMMMIMMKMVMIKMLMMVMMVAIMMVVLWWMMVMMMLMMIMIIVVVVIIIIIIVMPIVIFMFVIIIIYETIQELNS